MKTYARSLDFLSFCFPVTITSGQNSRSTNPQSLFWVWLDNFFFFFNVKSMELKVESENWLVTINGCSIPQSLLHPHAQKRKEYHMRSQPWNQEGKASCVNIAFIEDINHYSHLNLTRNKTLLLVSEAIFASGASPCLLHLFRSVKNSSSPEGMPVCEFNIRVPCEMTFQS